MSGGLGDLPDNVLGINRNAGNNSGNDDEQTNAVDVFFSFSEHDKGVSNGGEGDFRKGAINNLIEIDKKERDKRGNVEKQGEKKTPAPSQPKKKVQVPLDPHEVELELFKKRKQEKDANERLQNIYANRQIIPVARQIAEWFLLGMDWDGIRREAKRFIDERVLVDAIEFLRWPNPILMIARLAAFPALYNDDCGKCREFLRANHIKIHYIAPIGRCADCKSRENPERVCLFFGAKIFRRSIDVEDVDGFINELFVKQRLTTAQCNDLKEIPSQMERLSKALRLASCPPAKYSDWTKISAPKENSLTSSAANFQIKENAVRWAMKELSKGRTVTELRTMIEKKYPDYVTIVDDAIGRVRIIGADSLDTCGSEQFVFSPNVEFVKGEKCKTCEYAGIIGCNKHDLEFSETRMSLSGLNDEVSPEAEEILSYFRDSKLEIIIDPPVEKPPLDIELENLGKDMEVDVGKENSLGNIDGIFDETPPEMDVDIPPLPRYDDIDVSGLDVGMDLTGLV